MRVPFNSTQRNGYTLLEVLVVVVLMGLIAASIVPALASSSVNAKRDRLIFELAQIDVQSRLLAQQGNRCILQWDERERTLALLKHEDASQFIHRVNVPKEVELDLDSDENVITFDVFGRSRNYGYVLRSVSWSSQITFNGMSGWYEVSTDEQ